MSTELEDPQPSTSGIQQRSLSNTLLPRTETVALQRQTLPHSSSPGNVTNISNRLLFQTSMAGPHQFISLQTLPTLSQTPENISLPNQPATSLSKSGELPLDRALGGVQDGILGSTYQIKLLMLFAYKAHQLNLNFFLETEVKSADKFDDLCFKYKEGQGYKLRLLQAKHRRDAKKMNLGTLFNDKNYSLVKYYGSYQLVKKYKGIQDLIISTNNGFQFTTNQNDLQVLSLKEEVLYFEEIKSNDGIFTENTGKRYKIVSRQHRSEWQESKDTILFNFVALELSEFVLTKKVKDYQFLKFFENDLKSFVVDSKIQKFQEEFINNQYPHLAKFRKIFEKNFRSCLNETDVKLPKKLKAKFRTDFWDAMKEIDVKFTMGLFHGKSSAEFDVEDYMSKLMFVVDLDIKSLDYEIIKSIKDEKIFENPHMAFNMFETFIANWVKNGQSGDFFTEAKVAQFFEDLKFQIWSPQIIGIKNILIDKINESDLDFQDTKWDLMGFLYEDNQSVLNRIFYVSVSNDETFYGSIRVYGVLKKCLLLKDDDSYIYIKASLPKEQLDLAINVFQLKNCYEFCVMEFDNDKGLELYKKLESIVSLLDNKKLIVIGNKQNFPDKVYKSHDFFRPSKLSDLKNNCLNNLLDSKSIKFQNKIVTWSKLIDRYDYPILDDISLNDFYKIEELGATVPCSKVLKNDIFIERTLCHQTYVKNEVINDDNVKVAFTEEGFLEKMAMDTTDSSIHLLEVKNPMSGWNNNPIDASKDELKWIKSIRGVNDLRKYIDPEKGVEVKLNYFTDPSTSDKIVLISDCAGMGKSFLINYMLSKQLKEAFPEKWIIVLNLNDYTKELETFQNSTNKIDRQNAVDFLVENVLKLESIEAHLLRTSINKQKRVQIFFDSYDEIAPKFTELVLNWIKALSQSSIERIFVATRDELSGPIENVFNCFSYQINPFTSQDQENYLVKYFMSHTSMTEPDARRIAGELISTKITKINVMVSNSRSSSLSYYKQKKNKFVGIPLITMLVAETYKEDYLEFKENFTKSPNNLIDRFILDMNSRNLNSFELYEKFVEQRYDIYLKDRLGLNSNRDLIQIIVNEQRVKLHEAHQIISVKKLFSPDVLEILESKVNLQLDSNYIVPVTRCGIVEVSDKKFTFMHHTFVEFFTSKLLLNNFKTEEVCQLIVEKIFLDPKYQTLRTFINHKLPSLVEGLEDSTWKCKKLSDPSYVFVCNKKEHLKISSETHQMYNKVLMNLLKDTKNSIIFQRAAKEKNLNIFKFLYDCLKVEKTVKKPEYEPKKKKVTKDKIIESNNEKQIMRDVLLYADTENNLVFNYYFRYNDDDLEILDKLICDFDIDFVKQIFMHNNFHFRKSMSSFYVEDYSNKFETVLESAIHHKKNYSHILKWIQDNLRNDTKFIREIFCALDEHQNSILHNLVKIPIKSHSSRCENRTSGLSSVLKDFFDWCADKFGKSFVSDLFLLKNNQGKTFLYNLVSQPENLTDLLITILIWAKEKFGTNFVKKLLSERGPKAEYLLHFYAEKCKKSELEHFLTNFFDWILVNLGGKHLDKIILKNNNNGRTFLYYIVYNDDKNNSSEIIMSILDWLKINRKTYESLNKKLIFSKDIKHNNLLHYYALNSKKDQLISIFTNLLTYVHHNYGTSAVEELLTSQTADKNTIFLNMTQNFNLRENPGKVMIIYLEWLKASIGMSPEVLRKIITVKDRDKQTIFHIFAHTYPRSKFVEMTIEVFEWIRQNIGTGAIQQMLLDKDNTKQTFFNIAVFAEKNDKTSQEMIDFLEWIDHALGKEIVKKLLLTWYTPRQTIFRIVQENKKFKIRTFLLSLREWIGTNFSNDLEFIEKVNAFLRNEQFERCCYGCGCLTIFLLFFVLMTQCLHVRFA